MQNTVTLDINEILKILPHRYPFVLVDKITQLIKGQSIVGIKNVSFNEPHFVGHFPGNPIMPGVLIIEALAQVAAILVARSSQDSSKSVTPFLVGIDNAKFRKTVVPGDVLELNASIIQVKSSIWIIDTLARANGSKVAEAKIMATLKINH
jgi:3-hydroxyacyl-[acyl-carrier-protein] dehydratase